MHTTLDNKIADAMLMAGLSAPQIAAARQGDAIYGDNGMIDSLGLVRLIASVSSSFEDAGVDMFDMLQELDVEAVDAFSSFSTIRAFLSRVLNAPATAVA